MTAPTVSATDAPPVERQVAMDMIRRAVPVAPVIVAAAALVWGFDGGLSAAYGLAIVLANFALAAVLLSWAGSRSVALLMGVALFGYLLRLALVAGAVLAVKDLAWVELFPLSLTILVTHLGLLFWEATKVSASLTFPGLKPERKAA
ncbi:MAG: ATP synthase subunit I [Actinomycetota bacterium]|nr:ATP synthase subunit I [Actinomycetota bacterium]